MKTRIIKDGQFFYPQYLSFNLFWIFPIWSCFAIPDSAAWDGDPIDPYYSFDSFKFQSEEMAEEFLKYYPMIGLKVRKTSRGPNNKEPKPFKSGFKINTVTGIEINPYIGKLGFTFKEDDSVVNCDQVTLI
jgi:hypothetical protein